LYAKALDAGVADADEFVPYITNKSDAEAKRKAYGEKAQKKAAKLEAWDEAETLGKNETRCFLRWAGSTSRWTPPSTSEVRRAQARQRGHTEAQGQEGENLAQVAAPPYGLSLAPKAQAR
jgi:hypothetical protein